MNWPRLPDRPASNRAVTSFFKVFGGNPRLVGEAIRRADDEGHHRLEWRVISVLVPLVAGAAVLDGLWKLGGAWLAWLGVLPIGFALLHLVAFVVGGGTPLARWWRWNVILSAWSIWQMVDSSRSSVEWAAWLWIALLLLNALGGLGLGWRRLMTHPACCTITCRWLIWVLVHIPAGLLWWWNGWQWGAWFLFGVGALWASGTFLPNSVVFGPVVRRMEGKGVLLTFDDT